MRLFSSISYLDFKSKKRFLIKLNFLSFVVLVVLAFLTANSGYADNPKIYSIESNSDWILDRDRIIKNDDCDEIWEVLWSWSKKGNLEAREGLLTHIIYFGLDRPGTDQSFQSRQRDVVILGIHSIGVTKQLTHSQETALSLLRDSEDRRAKKFLACVDQKLSADCAKIAVEEKIIPSFEEYASEVDKAISKGSRPQCARPPKHD